MTEAILLLKELRTKVEGESWVAPAMKRAVLSGIIMSIQKLEKAVEAAESGDSEKVPDSRSRKSNAKQ